MIVCHHGPVKNVLLDSNGPSNNSPQPAIHRRRAMEIVDSLTLTTVSSAARTLHANKKVRRFVLSGGFEEWGRHFLCYKRRRLKIDPFNHRRTHQNGQTQIGT